MQKQFLRTLIVGGVLLSSLASAQVYRDRYGRDNSRYGSGRDSYGYGRGDVVSRTLNNLYQLQSQNLMENRDRNRLREAADELNKFQSRAREGRFDRGSLDDAIEEMQKVVNSNRVHPRARDILARDLTVLRDFRSSGGSYGSYGGRYDDRYGRRW